MIPVGSVVGTGLGGRDGGFVPPTDGGGTIIEITDDGLLVGRLVGFAVKVGSAVDGSSVGVKVGNGVGKNVGESVG